MIYWPLSFIDCFILFGGGLSILTAAAQLVRPNKKFENNTFFICYFITGFLIIYFYLNFYKPSFSYDFAIFPPVFSLLFSISPILYAGLHRMLIDKIHYEKRHLTHFAPAVAVLILGILDRADLLVIDPTHIPFSDDLGSPGALQHFFIVCWLLQLLAYLSALALKHLIRRPRKKPRQNRIPVMTTVLFLISVTVLMLLSQVLFIRWLLTLSLVMVVLNIVVWFFFTYIYPDLYPDLDNCLGNEEYREYRRSLLKSVERGPLREKIDALMRVEKAYCDEDLTLQRMASLTGITAHQLSEYLNSELSMNFKTFINTYRIEEAKSLLLSEPSRSILSVATAVGFNSKSVFYDAFRRYAGMSPVRFRNMSLSRRS